MINTSISKDKLVRDFKKLEGKIKTEQDDKKALQIKKADLEKNIVEINQGNALEAMNKMLEEKVAEIQNLKKQLKLPVEGSV